jgi:hypothetical protein
MLARQRRSDHQVLGDSQRGHQLAPTRAADSLGDRERSGIVHARVWP